MKKFLSFYVTSCLISWLLWTPLLLNPELKIFHLLGALGPFLSALLFKRQSIIDSLFHKKVPLKWIVFVILFPIVLLITTLLVTNGLNDFQVSKIFSTHEFGNLGIWYWLASIFFYGYGEEVGWRGVGIDALNEKFKNYKLSSFLFGLPWTLWHLPLFWYEFGYKNMDVGTIAGWIITCMFSSVLISWIYKKSHHSLHVIALFHGVIDIVMTSAAIPAASMIGLNILLLIFGVTIFIFAKNFDKILPENDIL